jgi:hypothetical protein
MKRHPTFEQLYKHRKLAVIYPATGRRFVISLRDWHSALWAVRVFPAVPCPSDKFNSFVQKHRLLPRPVIEEWLESLRLV